MRLTLLITLLLSCVNLQAQRIAKVKILLDKEHTIARLAQMGLDVKHGHYQLGKYFTGEFAEYELAIIEAAGFRSQVLIEDLQAWALDPERVGERSLPPCPASSTKTEWKTPANYTYGSMNGYLTYQEMLNVLDAMAAAYPHIFKAREPISTSLLTIEGREMFWVKISDNPGTNEAGEPEVLYTALHHAREPNSLSQMIFYMWYLLENYDADPEIKYLVDNTEMYFVPCVNPDGYVYNETTNPQGFGFWRKNRRPNDDGSFGVDLNRNYGYQWGYNDWGSSPNPSSETYRGKEAFSEPETQLIRDFCNAHEFRIALNYHTFSNLLIHPWAWSDSPTDDQPTFAALGELMTRENNYRFGVATQTVGYTVNGSSDDWMYGEMDTKEKIYSLTPEVGYTFWPSTGDIDQLNKDAMLMNLMTARLVLNYGEATPFGENFLTNTQGQIDFNLKKYGLASGSLSVSLSPATGNVLSTGAPASFNLAHLEEAQGAVAFTLLSSIKNGDTVSFDLLVDNGEFAWSQRIHRIYSTTLEVPFVDACNDFSQWKTDYFWDLTSNDYYSAPSSFTDSPDGLYYPNSFNQIVMKNEIPIVNATAAVLSFWAKWDIEEDEDFAQVALSIDGFDYFPVCGKYTEIGTPEQIFDQPVYDGTQQQWVREEIDLSEYLLLGDSLNFSISFWVVSDEFIEGDGFWFDDVQLAVVKEEIVSIHSLRPEDFTVVARPNPASGFLYVEVEGANQSPESLQLEVFNALGQPVAQLPVSAKTTRLDTKDWQPGVYYYRLSAGAQALPAQRFVIAK
jgi:hypothetical protein